MVAGVKRADGGCSLVQRHGQRLPRAARMAALTAVPQWYGTNVLPWTQDNGAVGLLSLLCPSYSQAAPTNGADLTTAGSSQDTIPNQSLLRGRDTETDQWAGDGPGTASGRATCRWTHGARSAGHMSRSRFSPPPPRTAAPLAVEGAIGTGGGGRVWMGRGRK